MTGSAARRASGVLRRACGEPAGERDRFCEERGTVPRGGDRERGR